MLDNQTFQYFCDENGEAITHSHSNISENCMSRSTSYTLTLRNKFGMLAPLHNLYNRS